MRKTFATALILLCSLAANALPLVWRADWPDAKPVETLVHRGTDIELQPTWFINGQEANPSNWTFTTYCQTNAVGSWFGPLPGAAFSHTNDVGAAFYNVMVRAQTPGGAVNYTAFARLRMLDSPGFAPGELPLPVPFIDFSKVVALHAPWTLQTDFDAAISNLNDSISTLNDTKLDKIDGEANNLLICGTNEAIKFDDDLLYIYRKINGAWVAQNVWDLRTSQDGVVAFLSDIPTVPTAQINAATTTNALQDAAIATINSKIPSAASASNQLADKAWTDDAIDSLAAYYITYTAAGAAFPTHAALTNATVVYSGGALRTPTRNDYAVVLADESHGGAEWRYIYTVAAGATSGQWDAQYPIETNDYDGLSNKPQINGHTLTGNQTGAALGLADETTPVVQPPSLLADLFPIVYRNQVGYTITIESMADVVFEHPGGAYSYELYKIGFGPRICGFEENGVFAGTGGGPVVTFNGRTGENYIWPTLTLSATGGSVVRSTDVAAVALAATNYTNASISPTSPAFSNAVLSVGLGIDTNTVAVINELVDSAHDLPVSGATSVGALLLALAAAVAALKKKFGYDTPVAITASAQLADRTNNRVEPTQGSAAIALTFPDAVAGKGRDFLVLVSPGANYSGTISFTTPANATIYGDGFGATIAAGESWLFSVTEIAFNVFYTRAQKMEVPS